MIPYMSSEPSEERCADSSNTPGPQCFTFLTWAKWIFPFRARIVSGTSLAGFEPRDPVQRVTPLQGLSTREAIRSSFSAPVAIRGRPNTGQAGSSGWMASFTPRRSQAGMTARRK
jgi:hypothetical protein